MSRPPRIGPWTVALWAALLILTATAGHPAGAGGTNDRNTPALGVLSAAADPAVLPARIADELPAATPGAPLRLLALLAAHLGALAGLAALVAWQVAGGGRNGRPRHARRHSIALRAPPAQLA